MKRLIIVALLLLTATSIVISNTWYSKQIASYNVAKLDSAAGAVYNTSYQAIKFPTDTLFLFLEGMDSADVHISYRGLDLAGNLGDSTHIGIKDAGTLGETFFLLMSSVPKEVFRIQYKIALVSDGVWVRNHDKVSLWYIYQEKK